MLKRLGKLYIFAGRLYRHERGYLITRDGFIIYGLGIQFSIHNFRFFDNLDRKFNPEDY